MASYGHWCMYVPLPSTSNNHFRAAQSDSDFAWLPLTVGLLFCITNTLYTTNNFHVVLCYSLHQILARALISDGW